VKKLSVLFAIALSFLCATSDGRARGQTFPGLPILNVKKIAFESRDAGASIAGLDGAVTNTTHGEISVIDAPNPNPRLLAKGQGPTWSPNAQKVAFCVSEESGLFRTEIINADGTGRAPLAAIKRDVCPSDWSPDGEKLALTDFSPKAPTVVIADVNGGNFRTITEGSDPQWSPDGKQLLVYRDVKGKKDRTAIWIVDVDGTGARKIIEEDTPSAPSISWNSLGPARFFDGNRIVFSSDRTHNWCIFRINLDGTNLEKIVEHDQFDLFHPSFSPDGKQLVVQGDSRPIGTSVKPEKVILLFDLTSKQWTQLAIGTSPNVLWETKTPFGEVILDRASTSTNNSLVAQGKARYLYYKCDECHGPNGEGGGDGPDLFGTHLDAAEISKFLEKPSPDAYMKGMPDIPATNPDHQALVAFVLSLKRPPN
jgi:mono/diheme cytochrome c family protein